MGGYQRIHEIHREQTELIRDYLTGDRSPTQQEAPVRMHDYQLALLPF